MKLATRMMKLPQVWRKTTSTDLRSWKRTVKKHLPNRRRKNDSKGKSRNQQGRKVVVENKNASKNNSAKKKVEDETK